ncbi:uncharacterized protein LOC144716999 [Wolffia australiana]
MEAFEAFFRLADLDSDGRISGAEAVNFFQGSGLPKHVLAQIWMYSDTKKAGFLSREQFYNALKLVTVAQRGRELTPEIVKAALEGPASAKIPPPQITTVARPSSVNPVSGPRPPVMPTALAPTPSPSVSTPTNQVFTPISQHLTSNQALFTGQGAPGTFNAAPIPKPSPNNPSLSADWRVGALGVASQAVSGPLSVPLESVPRNSVGQTVQAVSANSSVPSTKPVDHFSSLQMQKKDPNELSSDSGFGGGLFSASSQSKETSATSVGIIPTSSTGQAFIRPVMNSQVQSNSSLTGSVPTQSQKDMGQGRVTSVPSERSWPKFSTSDILKYTKVFAEVDKDRDGKITGEEARTLFLSWKLPREVLKQVWDLSDQDNDSMLSHREFVTALYLMERFREGYTLPPVLPNSVKFDETLIQATSHPSIPYMSQGGFPQARMPGPQAVIPSSGVKPQSLAREIEKIDVQEKPVPQKKSIPVLESHLVYQLSKGEQDALNSKFQEATDADKKVQELEKEILDSKEKIEFYRTKMQELVLYKSRCDSRLNEITEKTAADKREVDLLTKKYEEKFRNVGDVASKLTVEEATFRDIQEKKLELYNAIVKMEQGGSADGVLQVRAERIQADIDELIKSLNLRCKKYGLHVKPTTLIELPFGWQPKIQESAADWDEDWDKYADEGFSLVKELTVDVKNIIAPPKPKPSLPAKEKPDQDEISSPVSPVNEDKLKNGSAIESKVETETSKDQSEDGSVRSPTDSPAARSSLDNASQLFHSPRFSQNGNSPRPKESLSDHGGGESTFSGERFGDEMPWGANFDSHDDADSLWDFNSKDPFQQPSFFEAGELGLNPIRTGSPSARSTASGPLFAESIPSTSQFYPGFSPRFNDGPDDNASSFDAFSRFDSFSNSDARFDSFSRRESLSRSDSVRSTADQVQPAGFFSFDDPDPFRSTGPFKPTSDRWNAF